MEIKYHNLLLANYSLLNQGLHERIRKSELSPGQPKVLNYLSVNNGAAQKDIAEGCYLTPGSLTTILTRMEKLGMVERRREDGNMKEIHVYLTEKGKKLSDKAEDIFNELNKIALTGLTPEEKDIFLRTFLKIYANMQKF